MNNNIGQQKGSRSIVSASNVDFVQHAFAKHVTFLYTLSVWSLSILSNKKCQLIVIHISFKNMTKYIIKNLKKGKIRTFLVCCSINAKR